MSTVKEELTLLPETVVEGLINSLDRLKDGRAMTPEYEVGDPSGVFVGLGRAEEDDEAVAYVYVADPDAHCQRDEYGESGERNSNLFEETLQLNRLSTEFLFLLDMEVDSVSADSDNFELSNEPTDGEGSGMGAYYALRFPLSEAGAVSQG